MWVVIFVKLIQCLVKVIYVQNKEALCRDRFNLGLAAVSNEDAIVAKPGRDRVLHDFLTDVGRVEALKRRKEIVNAELDHIKNILKHKQICISAGGTMKTLHPALSQTTTSIANNTADS